ncbi:MAG: 16S rRNA (cytosine(1402)-N(4))-methyltransferase RsmH [Planctomycetes bacterium]|nr:16S rRNA (cytosine(1402)-N(4))-methyltransferase RsmH [Planctomycetota bacterium]
MTEPAPPHQPVLAAEVLDLLGPPLRAAPGAWLFDGTLGAGGHAALLLEACPEARLFGCDRDPDALELARARLAPFGDRATLVRATYADGVALARERGLPPLGAALLDLGVSSMQLDRPERGFSFSRPGPLDMRMDPGAPLTARALVNELPEGELADVIYQLGEERLSRRIARAIVAARRQAPLETTEALAEVVRRAVPRPRGRERIHPATRTFQALRLAVNDELGQLERALPALWDLLAPGGRLAVISFHSLEDRPVKTFARARKQDGTGRPLTKKPLRPTDAECDRNPRARSAKMRVVERL